MRLLVPGLLIALSVRPGSAQEVHGAPDHRCTLYVVGGEARPGPPLDPAALASARQAARRSGGSETVTTVGERATFVVEYNGFTPEAQAAFQVAVDIWSDLVGSPVPIRVDATFGPLGSDVLGSAGPTLTANFSGAPSRNTWYPFALADAIAGLDQFPPDANGDNPDITATFSSTQPAFYFGTDGNPGSQQFDFVSVVLHELGHGLGFVGSAAYDNGVVSAGDEQECDGVEGHGCWGIPPGSSSLVFPVIYDRLVEDGGGTSLLSTSVYPQNSNALGTLLTSNGRTSDLSQKNIFVDGETVRPVNGGAPAPIQADDLSGAGSLYSHWDEFVYSPPSANALMTPFLGRGEALHDPGPLTCALFRDIGWTLRGECATAVAVEAETGPEAGGLGLAPLGPNPFRTATTYRLDVPAPTAVVARLVDALGREVRTLYAGAVWASGVELVIDGVGLAPGVYRVLVRGEEGSTSASIVRAR